MLSSLLATVPLAEPSTQALLSRLLDLGGQAGVLYLAIYFLVRVLREQYDRRIDSLERRSTECEQDRRTLHRQMDALQTQRIGLLEDLLRARELPAPEEIPAPPRHHVPVNPRH